MLSFRVNPHNSLQSKFAFLITRLVLVKFAGQLMLHSYGACMHNANVSMRYNFVWQSTHFVCAYNQYCITC